MSGTNIVPEFQVYQYSATIELLVQQMHSRLRGAVRTGAHVGSQASPVDQVGVINVSQVTSRFADIIRTDAPTNRRWCFPSDFDLAQQVDSFDKLRIINNPEGALVQAAAASIGRQYDDLIIAAFFSTAYTGDHGQTATAFSTNLQSTTGASASMIAGNNNIPVNFKSSAAIGLTAAKIIAAKQTLQLSEVDVDMEEMYIAIGANQAANLMSEILITSKDFNSAPVFDSKGMISSWYGFNFIHTERLLLSTLSGQTAYTAVPVWCKSGMYLGVWNDLYTKVSQLDHIRGQPWQVYNMMTAGATRLQEPKVVQVLCS